MRGFADFLIEPSAKGDILASIIQPHGSDAVASGRPMTATNLRIKIASEPWELEQVYGLNYRTFVEEIPQHSPNEERRLVDQRLERSDCYVCLDGRRLRGMVAVCGQRPFSLRS